MTVTITAVPEVMSRAQFTDWLSSVGIDVRLCQSVTIDREGIRATVYATDDEGRRYAHPGATTAATHVIHIRITDE